MLNTFRAASLLEGISFLVILGVSVGIISREYVFYLGMGHGILFLVYFVLSLAVSHRQQWSVIQWLLVLLAAIIPFAFIAVDLFIKKEMAKTSLTPAHQ